MQEKILVCALFFETAPKQRFALFFAKGSYAVVHSAAKLMKAAR